MAFEHYVRSGTKQLRMGYTTGACAALAASGAVRMLLTGIVPEAVSLLTPKGLSVDVPLHKCKKTDTGAMCAVQKDSGDDPDITNGCIVQAFVSLTGEEIIIDGGEGVGRVTKPGLDRPVGDAAINTVPRRMIAEAVEAVCTEEGYDGGVRVVIAVPGGEEMARKTFNPALGVEGGISILGTSGIVEPMSMQALVDTIELEIRQAVLSGVTRLVLTPGNIGKAFFQTLGVDENRIRVVRCSNFIGEALDAACAEHIPQVLLAGHTGKLVKIAGGIMQTHSRYADCRMELFCAHAALRGASQRVCADIMDCATTDAALDVLEEAHLAEAVLDSLATAVQKHLDRRAGQAPKTGAVLFSRDGELVTYTKGAKELLAEWKEQGT